MASYKAMPSHKMVAELKDDASKWAAAFMEHFPDCGVDEDTMLGWFANAIEVSHDHRIDRQKGMPAQDPDPVAATDVLYEHMSLFEGRLQAHNPPLGSW